MNSLREREERVKQKGKQLVHNHIILELLRYGKQFEKEWHNCPELIKEYYNYVEQIKDIEGRKNSVERFLDLPVPAKGGLKLRETI